MNAFRISGARPYESVVAATDVIGGDFDPGRESLGALSRRNVKIRKSHGSTINFDAVSFRKIAGLSQRHAGGEGEAKRGGDYGAA